MKKVLIADDSSMARSIIRRCLEIAGGRDWEYVEAPDGAAALEVLRQGGVDLLVTDLNMPTLDGLELVRRARSSPRLNGLPVVVVTSAGNPDVQKKLEEAGAASVLLKPVSPAKLAETLASLAKEDP
ncbi:MAG: response regulator [Deltaproteobacteria bacterium]|nr:response regulator [Deltaproteobacteria bacterium]